MVKLTSRLQGNDKTNENNEKQTVASISLHRLLRCLRVRYLFGLVIIFCPAITLYDCVHAIK